MTQGRWSNDAFKKLRELAGKNKPITSICLALARPICRVEAMARELQVAITPSDAYLLDRERDSVCQRLYNKGHSDVMIGETLGVAKQLVRRWRQWHCLEANRKTEAVLQREREGMRCWLDEQGYSSAGHLSKDLIRSKCALRGWPQVDVLSDCDVLDLLEIKGPLHFVNICKCLGFPIRTCSECRPRVSLLRLERRGLLTVTEPPRGRQGRRPYLYRIKDGVRKHQTKLHHKEEKEREPA